MTDISGNCGNWEKLAACLKEYLEQIQKEKVSITQSSGKKQTNIVSKPADDKVETAWKYDGFLRPGYIKKTRKVAADVVDIGKVKLAEIRNCSYSSQRKPAPLSTLWGAASYENGKIPPPNSNKWEKLPAPQWNPGVLVANYGRGIPLEKSFQTIKLSAKPIQLVRGESVKKSSLYRWGLCFYDANKQESTHPLGIDLVDCDNDGKEEIFVYTVIPKTWPRSDRVEDGAFALLTENGKQLFKYNVHGNIQDLKVLDYLGNKKREILLATMDAKIRIFDSSGKIIKNYDLFKMHQDFHKKYGRSNTRHPAAGYTTPYSLGLWRRKGSKPYKMVVSRYGNLSFLDAEGHLEGVLKAGLFCTPYMLPYGIDFNKDGQDEQLYIEKNYLIHLSGNNKPRIKNPGSNIFWPEVYDAAWTALPSSGLHTYPDKVYVLKPLAWGTGNRYVLIVSRKYIVIYDALRRKWVYRWSPLMSIEKAAIVTNTSDSLQIMICSEDNSLALISWEQQLKRISGIKKLRSDGYIKNIYSKVLPGNKTLVLLAGNRGIYRLNQKQEPVKIINGAFYDAKPLCSNGKLQAVIASTIRGEIIRFNLK
jgi:hypothetical protein